MTRKRKRPPVDRSAELNPTCPKCGTDRAPLLWAEDPNTGARTYRCVSETCRGRWQVEGVQAELFELPQSALTLTGGSR